MSVRERQNTCARCDTTPQNPSSLCEPHQLRDTLASLAPGDTVKINNFGTFTLTAIDVTKTVTGAYSDTVYRFEDGPHGDRVTVWGNDNGTRDAGKPSLKRYNETTDVEATGKITSLSVVAVIPNDDDMSEPTRTGIRSEITATDYLDSLA